jgi:hypothetical protein
MSPFDSAAEHEEKKMQMKLHDPALSAPTNVGALSARSRAGLEREVRSAVLLRRERATASRSQQQEVLLCQV